MIGGDPSAFTASGNSCPVIRTTTIAGVGPGQPSSSTATASATAGQRVAQTATIHIAGMHEVRTVVAQITSMPVNSWGVTLELLQEPVTRMRD